MSSSWDVTKAEPESAPVNAEEVKEAVPTVQPRKIIYNARVELVDEDLSSVVDSLAGLIKPHGGYVAETDVSGSVGGRRMGMWKVRVPVERFDAFLEAVAKLDELQRNHVDSQDVTQEFYDIEARIANNQLEVKRLQKHLGESTGNLEDILAVEREIGRVRGEIEQMQGRLRYLANVSALSTVTVSASELRNFVPPIGPAFTTQVGRTFLDSMKLLVDFGKGMVLVVVAASLWLPVNGGVLPKTWSSHNANRTTGRDQGAIACERGPVPTGSRRPSATSGPTSMPG